MDDDEFIKLVKNTIDEFPSKIPYITRLFILALFLQKFEKPEHENKIDNININF